MINKPHMIPLWAAAADARKIEPLDSIKQSGWKYEDAPSSEVVNWWMNLVYQWLVYFDDSVDDIRPDLIKFRELIIHQQGELAKVKKMLDGLDGAEFHTAVEVAGWEEDGLIKTVARLLLAQEELAKKNVELGAKNQQLEQKYDQKIEELQATQKTAQEEIIKVSALATLLYEKVNHLEGHPKNNDVSETSTTNPEGEHSR